MRKQWGRFNFFASKEAYLIVRQLEKIMVKKAQAKVIKWAKNNVGSLGPPLGHLSVNPNMAVKILNFHVFFFFLSVYISVLVECFHVLIYCDYSLQLLNVKWLVTVRYIVNISLCHLLHVKTLIEQNSK